MKLILVSTDGNVLDSSEDFTREEWDSLSPAGAFALLDGMSAGTDAL